MTFTEKRVISGDAEIYTEERGTGSAVLLLHGNGEDMRTLYPLAEALAGRYRVVSVDSRGHGRSMHGGEELTLAAMSEDLIPVMDEYGLKKAAIVGFSDGANIAMRTAFMYPESVSALVLSGGNASPYGIRYGYYMGMYLGRIITYIRAMGNEQQARKLELLNLMLREPRYTDSALRMISAPTLVTAGERDMIKPVHTRWITRKIPGAALRIFEGADHFVPHKQPEEYNRVVREFLDKVL